jgi:hypothetical protein
VDIAACTSEQVEKSILEVAAEGKVAHTALLKRLNTGHF